MKVLILITMIIFHLHAFSSEENNKTISLVLGSGGARGYAHIGAIDELEKQGYQIKSIAGTSMGALIGGLYAVGKLDEFEKWALTLDYYEMFKLLGFSSVNGGLIDGEKVFDKIRVMIGDVKIEDLPIKYTAIATDITTQKEVVFRKGKLIDAIRASIAIPSIFTPVIQGNSILVDGGVLNPIPISATLNDMNDLVVVVNLDAHIKNKYQIKIPDEQKSRDEILYEKVIKFIEKTGSYIPADFLNTIDTNKPIEVKKLDSDKQNIFYILRKTVDTARTVLARYAMQNHKADIVIDISAESCEFYDFTKAYEMIEIGRMATKEKF